MSENVSESGQRRKSLSKTSAVGHEQNEPETDAVTKPARRKSLTRSKAENEEEGKEVSLPHPTKPEEQTVVKPNEKSSSVSVEKKKNRKSLGSKDADESVDSKTTETGLDRKFVLRPSVLGDVTSAEPIKEGSFSGGTNSDLIVEGKRQWKPTMKMQQVKKQVISNFLSLQIGH